MNNKSNVLYLKNTEPFSSDSMPKTMAIRASLLHFLEDPAKVSNLKHAFQYFEDGLLVR